MTIPDAISFGPLVLPTAVIAGAAVFLISYLAGRLFLRTGSDEKKAFDSLITSPLLPFLLSWKLSLLVTDARDVVKDPRALLYGSGSTVNAVIGLCIAAVWMGYRWYRTKPGKSVNTAAVRSLVTAALLSAALLAANGLAGSEEQAGRAPSTEITTPSGGTWSIDEAAGSPVVLNFWASWCPPCRAEMPMLASMAVDPKFDDVVFFAVNAAVTERGEDAGEAWLRENGIDIPLLIDLRGEALVSYRIEAFPTTLVLDASGAVTARKTGAVTRRWIAGAVRKARRQGGGD